MTRRLTTALLLFSLVLLAAPKAEACSYGGCNSLFAGVTVGVGALGLTSLGVAGVSATHNLRGQWLDKGLAIGNIVLGAVDLTGGVFLLAVGHGSEASLGLGVPFAAVGLFMVIEGIVSLALREEHEEQPVGLSLAPGPGDAGVSLRVTW